MDGRPEVDEREMAWINRLSRKVLGQDEVYLFSVRLCDNEVDRDGERFSGETLEGLAEKFVGKSGIFDHQWSAKGQAARIYRTEVVDEPGVVTKAGDGYRYLKGWAYMLRTEGNRDLIAEIEGGIKKEVSVGCAVERAVCSICGEDLRQRDQCRHVKGEHYGGKLCWAELSGAKDAYEWSFVAVPAQPKAGVMKTFGGGVVELRKALEGQAGYLAELDRLEQEAALGRAYLDGLRREVIRLGGLVEGKLDAGTLKSITGKLDEAELLELKRGYEERVKVRFPVGVQLTYRGDEPAEEGRDGAFLI